MLLSPYTFFPAHIRSIVRESRDAVSVLVSLNRAYLFQPGQYALVRVGIGEGDACMSSIRQYSFSSAPESNEVWLTITREPGGMVSTWFCEEAKVGDSLDLSAPYDSPLARASTRPLLLLAAGSGIAPLMSHIRASRLRGSTEPLELLYTTKTTNECFHDELASPAPHETIVVNYSDVAGRFTKKDLMPFLSAEKNILICGPRSFVEDMQAWCRGVVPPEHIKTEAFTL